MIKSITSKLFLTAAILSAIVGTVCAIAVFGVPNVYADGVFTYTVTDGCVTVTGYTGDEADVVIPESIDGYPVTAIGAKAFFWRTDLKSILLPRTLTSVGENAFDGCTGLTSLAVPENVTAIESYAFANCTGLTELHYNVKAELAFGGDQYAASRQVFGNLGTNASGVTVVFGAHVTKIPDYIFCPIVGETYNVKTVSVEGALTEIGKKAFFHCYSLTSFCKENAIAVPDTVKTVREAAFDTCTGVARIELPASVTEIETLAFTQCKNVTELYFDAYEITAFGSDQYAASRQVFGNLGIEASGATVVFGAHVTKIPDYIFCPIVGETYNVKTVSVEGALTEIGKKAFFHCYSLTSFCKENAIAVPDTVKTVREAAFDTCTGVTRIELPASVTEIETLAFTQCKNVTELYFDAYEITAFGGDQYAASRYVFFDLGLNTAGVTVIFGNSVTQIPDNMFTSIGGETYNVKTVILHGANLTCIGLNAFAACNTLDTALYCGSLEQFEQNVTVDSGNDFLLSALGYHLSHDMSDIEVTAEPSCTANGSSLLHCSVCLLTEVAEIPAVGHAFEAENCTRCGLYAPYGDANGDGTVNGKDVVRLLRHLAFYDVTTGHSAVIVANGDANGDGVINSRDATRLLRYLSSIDPSTGKSEISLGTAQ